MGKKIVIRQEIKLDEPDLVLKKCNECNNYFPATEQYFSKYSKGKYGFS